MHRRGAQALHAFFQHEATDVAQIALGIGFPRPHHEHIGDGAVGDPHLAAAEAVATGHFFRARDHRGRVGAVVRFGQAEAADPLAGGQLGQELLALCLGAEFENRHHHQRGLHAHHRAVAGVDALDFTRDHAVANIVQSRPAVFGRDGRAHQAQFAHFAKDRRIGLLMPEGLQHARCQLALAVVGCGFAHHALVFGQLLIQQQRVVPFELRFGGFFHRCVHVIVRAG